jgi:transposase
VRDQRPWSGAAPPGAVYFFSPDRKGEHPRGHLGKHQGILQADAYVGFKEALRTRCRRHAAVPRGGVLGASPARLPRRLDGDEVGDRQGGARPDRRALRHRARDHRPPAEVRLAARQAHSGPKVEAFKHWAEEQLRHIPGKSDLAKAFRYALNRWPSFCLFLEDGRVAIDNNAAERGMRPVGVGRRNWLFAGSDAGGETLARAMTIIETAKTMSAVVWRCRRRR